MGQPVAELKAADEQNKLANGNDTKKNNGAVESNSLNNNENMVGCCQGVNGVSCCQTASFEQNKVETDKKQGSKVCGSWPKLQKRDILTATGIIGALAAVAIGYRFYRRSG